MWFGNQEQQFEAYKEYYKKQSSIDPILRIFSKNENIQTSTDFVEKWNKKI